MSDIQLIGAFILSPLALATVFLFSWHVLAKQFADLWGSISHLYKVNMALLKIIESHDN